MIKKLGRVACLVGGIAIASMAAQAQTLTIGVRGGPDSMDPHYSALGSHAEAAKHIFDTLVWADEKLQLSPSLAESWKPIGETTWEFKLRKGVKFHDGSDFTAEDVKFSIERMPIVTGPTTTAIYVRRVAAVKIIDDHTVHIETNGPAATLANDFVRLFIVSSKAAKDYNTKETAAKGFNSGKATIGTGPYKYVSWEPKGDLVLARNDDYWRGKGAWEKVIRKEMSNDSSRLAALKAGQVDLVNYISSADWASLKNDSKVEIFKGESVYIMNLQLDQRDTTPKVYDLSGNPMKTNPFKNPMVREAIDLSIDREAMVDVVLEGLGKPANQMMPVGFFGSSDKIPARVHDLKKARALMTEAGYKDGFKVDLYCTSDRLPGDGAICQGLGQMFSSIGIQTNVNAVSRSVYFPAQGRLEYSMFMNGWGTLTGEASYTLGSLAHTKNPEVKMGAYNRLGYSNPAIDTALQEGAATLDATKRRALFEKAMELTMADRVYIPVVGLSTVWAATRGKFKLTPRIDENTLAFFIKPAN